MPVIKNFIRDFDPYERIEIYDWLRSNDIEYRYYNSSDLIIYDEYDFILFRLRWGYK